MFKRLVKFSFIPLFGLACLANLSAMNNHQLNLSTSPYTSNELDMIKQYLFNNITTTEHVVIKDDHGQLIRSVPGAVIASPSNHGANFTQDYQFHWVRDAAITMNEVVYLYQHASPDYKRRLKPYLINYINFERKAQRQPSRPGEQTLGQPKFNLDATVWEGDWGRPQNDGPGLRAATLTAIANAFLDEGEKQYVRDVIIPVIETDLNYVAAEWHHSNFDLWEEVNDQDHFFNKMVQRKGFIVSAALFNRMGENDIANRYLYVAKEIEASLDDHWNEGRGYISETIHQQYIKGGGLNAAIILGVLNGDVNDSNDAYAVNNERVMSSVFYLRNAFTGLYKVNIDNDIHPPLIGRYPNDVYDGKNDQYGNPWVLTTHALAQYYYALANTYLKLGKIEVTKINKYFFKQLDANLVDKEGSISISEHPGKFYAVINALISEGDQALANVKKFAVCNDNYSCLHFAEQLDRSDGAQVSAKDLTWGYTTLLAAMQERAMLNN